MSETAETHRDAAGTSSGGQPAAVSPVVRQAARWFWWIAGLSLVNIVLNRTGSELNFVLGLGITALSDAVFASSQPIALVIDTLALAFFVGIGAQAQLGRLWAFYLGTVAYALDALIYLRVQDWMPVGFHALAIFFIVKGILSLRQAPDLPVSPGTR